MNTYSKAHRTQSKGYGAEMGKNTEDTNDSNKATGWVGVIFVFV